MLLSKKNKVALWVALMGNPPGINLFVYPERLVDQFIFFSLSLMTWISSVLFGKLSSKFLIVYLPISKGQESTDLWVEGHTSN